MSTVIAVTSADMALPAQDERTVPAAVLQDVDRQPLEQVLDGMQGLLDQYGHVIVVTSPGVAGAVVRRLHTVRSLLESDRIALFRPRLPPLGVAVLARQLRQLASCGLGPGVLASAGRLLTHYVHCGAVLPSVAHLDHVPVGLRAHARSWVPGTQFAVVAHPEPQLVRVGPDAVLRGPDFGTWMVVARGRLQSDWAGATLAPAWRVLGLHESALPAESARWWGTGKLVEFCAYLPDLSVLYQLVASVRQGVCHWCGIDVIGDRCVFCSATLPVGDAPAPATAAQARAAASAAPADDGYAGNGSGYAGNGSGYGGNGPGYAGNGSGNGGNGPGYAGNGSGYGGYGYGPGYDATGDRAVRGGPAPALESPPTTG
ncbi:hypothetical protein GCM10010499_42090 [Streptomyces thermoviolaceus subsp. apingens]|nr:hypothetical protein GCM10010499_42090 [Streptomyces thermoviolaceus subsp. apingens]